MSKRREVIYYDDSRLMGSQLTRDDCAKLDYILSIDKTNEGLDTLSELVYNLPEETVIAMERKQQDCPTNLLIKGTLRSYQTLGVAFAYYAQSVLIGDSVGLGKTHISAGLINLLRTERAALGQPTRVLFLTDRNAVVQNSRELMKTTGLFFATSSGTQKDVGDLLDYPPRSLVASHSIIKSYAFQDWLLDYERKHHTNMFDLIIIDEGSVVAGSSTTQFYKMGMEIFKSCSRKVLLNATPFESSLEKFFNQLNFIDPTFLMTKTEFEKNYTKKVWNGYHVENLGYKNAEDFRQKIQFRYYASTRKELGAIMKDCSAEVLKVPLTRSQRELLSRTSLPYQVYDCPQALDPDATTNKLQALESLLQDRLQGNQVLIYTRYKETQQLIADLILDLGATCKVLNGDSKDEERQAAVDSFRQGNTQVLVTNVQKALNFGNCDHVIFYGFDPNPSKMVQVEGRTTRSLDIIDKHVYVILTEGNEYKRFATEIKHKAAASADFAGRDFSLILDLLKEQI